MQAVSVHSGPPGFEHGKAARDRHLHTRCLFGVVEGTFGAWFLGFVDVRFHAIGAEATGAMFARFPDSVIFDQRLLWMFPLLCLAAKGAGPLSLDAAMSRLWQQCAPARVPAAGPGEPA